MRILQVNSAKEIGGGEIHLQTLINGLIARQHSVMVVARPRSPLLERLDRSQVKIMTAPLRNAADLASAWRLARIIKTEQIEIIHCHHARDYLVGAMAVRFAPQARLILTRHLLYPMKQSAAYRWGLAPTSRVIAVSEAVREVVLAGQCFSPEKVVSVHNGIELDRFQSNGALTEAERTTLRDQLGLPAQSKRFLVGVIGQLAPHKGQSDFLRAMVLLAPEIPAAHFVIVGRDQSRDQSYRRALIALAEALGLSERVTFKDFTPDVPELLRALDVMVLPSWAEPFGLILVEAMASQTAVVATAAGGPAEIVEPEQTGLLVPPRQVVALAAAVRRLWAEPEFRQRLAAQASELVRQRFSAARMVAETEKVYAAALGA